MRPLAYCECRRLRVLRLVSGCQSKYPWLVVLPFGQKKYLDGASPCVSQHILLLVLQLVACWCSWCLTSCSKEESWEALSNDGEMGAFCLAVYNCVMRSSNGVVCCCRLLFSMAINFRTLFPCEIPEDSRILIRLWLTPCLLYLSFETIIFQVSCIHFETCPFPNGICRPHLHELNRSDDRNMVR